MCLPLAINCPEDVLSKGDHVGFEWMTMHNRMGYRCGYVRIPTGHPWHGQDYDEINCSVHGGLTFAREDKPCKGDRPDDAYWIGFDCAHGGDAPDPQLPDGHIVTYRTGTIRNQNYVESECRLLCQQAQAAAL